MEWFTLGKGGNQDIANGRMLNSRIGVALLLDGAQASQNGDQAQLLTDSPYPKGFDQSYQFSQPPLTEEEECENGQFERVR